MPVDVAVMNRKSTQEVKLCFRKENEQRAAIQKDEPKEGRKEALGSPRSSLPMR